MKVSVSFLSSKYTFPETMNKINESNADFIHVDIMDGKYVCNNTFDKKKIAFLSKNSSKNCDVHLMVKNPIKFLKYFKNDVFNLIYFHPKTEKNPMKFINAVKKMNKSIGIVVNPDDNLEEFKEYFEVIDNILVMSVNPGKGGQDFIENTVIKVDRLNDIIRNNKLNLKIALDGGINSESIKYIKNKNIEYVVSGSFICNAENYNEKINELTL